MANDPPLTMESYLEQVGQCRNSAFGKRYRNQFRDHRGTAELAMLAAPSQQEYEAFCRAVAIMTDKEKEQPESLSAQQIEDIARTAGIAAGNLHLFLNGYLLARKNGSKQTEPNNLNTGDKQTW